MIGGGIRGEGLPEKEIGEGGSGKLNRKAMEEAVAPRLQEAQRGSVGEE